MSRRRAETTGARRGRLARRLRRACGVATLIAVAMAVTAGSAGAEGSKEIAKAPTIPLGQQQFGNLNNGAVSENGCGDDVYTEWWSLSASAGDRVRIDWEAQQLEYTAMLIYPAGTTDFTYPATEELLKQELNSNKKNEATLEFTTDGSFPVAFTSSAWSCLSGPPGPYDFTAYLQHGLAISLKPYAHIRTTTTVAASARLANGAPVPDGLAFNLTVSWSSRESATYTATSVGGALAFPMALPDAAKGRTATLVVSRPEDAQYLAAQSGKVEAKVGRGTTPSPVAVVPNCAAARRRTHILARQHHRLTRHARFVRGARKRQLRHKAHKVARKLRAARGRAAKACARA